MNTLISILIPTYQRPELLGQAVASCLEQTYGEIEIVVSDDSRDDLSEQALRRFAPDGRIRYFRNDPSLGQAGNVNRVFALARGDRSVLLHDDDLLLPRAVEHLARCWDGEPRLTAAFGKQQIITADGTVLRAESEVLNRDYYRTAQYAGRQRAALWSALVSQFPNDGYMITTAAARETLYSTAPEVGDACDYDFGLRLAASYESFYFLDKFTAAYRLTPVSISSANSCAHLSYDLTRSTQIPAELRGVRDARLRRYAAPAVSAWLRLGEGAKARQVFLSEHYPGRQRWSPRGLAHAAGCLCPSPVLRLLRR